MVEMRETGSVVNVVVVFVFVVWGSFRMIRDAFATPD